MGMISEFKDFAMKGNLVDLATGFILGGAFSTVVSSMVDDIIMPVVGLFSGKDFSNLFYNLGDGTFATLAAAEEAGAPIIRYGQFINALISFLIVALVLFFIIRGVNRATALAEDALGVEDEPEAEKGPTQEELLKDIRDLLAVQTSKA